MDSSDDSKESFFKHVFYFNDKSKSEILNMFQYTFIGVIPILIVNKLISKYIPEADETKSSLEIIAEIVIQILVMFSSLFFINRFITYFPTYSGSKYTDYNITGIVLITLMIILSLQTRLGEKVNILYDRVIELWEGKAKQKDNKKNPKVKVSHPISGQQNSMGPSMNQNVMNQSAMNQSLYTDSTSINSLPMNPQAPSSTQQLPNYNNMYQNDNTPLVGAATPGAQEGFMNEIVPANSVLGGSFGSSW